MLVGANGRLRLAARHLRIRPSVMARVLRLSGTGMLQVFIGTASWILLVRIVSGFGSEALAGYTISVRIALFALLPAWGLSNAAATMVGQGLGAGDPDRAERAVWIAAAMNLAFLGAVGIVFLLAAPALVGVFGADAAAFGHAVHGLRIISAGFFFYAVGMVVTQSFNGAGAPWTPTLLNLFCFWLWEIPLAWVLSHRLALGPDGVFIADRGRVLDARRGGRVAVPSRALEAGRGVARRARRCRPARAPRHRGERRRALRPTGGETEPDFLVRAAVTVVRARAGAAAGPRACEILDLRGKRAIMPGTRIITTVYQAERPHEPTSTCGPCRVLSRAGPTRACDVS